MRTRLRLIVLLTVAAAAATVSTSGRTVLRRRSDRARAGEPQRGRRQAARHRAVLRVRLQPVRERQAPAVEHARGQRQHHRRSARLELVHQPHRRRADDRRRSSRAASTPTRRRRRRSGRCCGRSRPAPIRASPRATRTARPGSCSSTRPSSPKASTAAVEIDTKLFWALGYNQVETFITTFDPAHVDDRSEGDGQAARSATRTPFTQDDITRVLERAARNADGTYRASAGRLLPGKVLGSFRYQGTRSDDPNDLVPHEHRRELRALRVFGAWTNLVDLKAGNTLDTLVEENGRVDRQALPAGRRLVAGHGEQQARMGHGLGVLLRRPGDEEALLSRSASRSARGRRCRTPSIRRSASSRAIASIRRPGSRRRRSRPTWSCAPTMRSGRRGG